MPCPPDGRRARWLGGGSIDTFTIHRHRFRPGESVTDFRTQAEELDAADPALLAFRRDLLLPDDAGVRPLSHTLGGPHGRTVAARRRYEEEWRELGVSGWRGEWSGGRAAWAALEEVTREPLARVLGCAPRNVALVGRLSENLWRLLVCMHRGRREAGRPLIIAHEHMFPSDELVLRGVIEFHGGDPDNDLVKVRSDARGILDEGAFAAELERCGERASILHYERQPYFSGQVLDAAAFTPRARELGVLVSEDSAHAAGILALDFDRVRPHLAVWCGYKNFCVAKTGGIYVDMDWVDERPDIVWPRGWWGLELDERLSFSPDLREPRWADGALRFGMSTPAPDELMAWAAILETYEECGGIDAVHRGALSREDLFLAVLDEHPGFGEGRRFELLTPREPARRGGELVLLLGDRDAGVVHDALKTGANGVRVAVDTRPAPQPGRTAVRIGFHPGMVSHVEAVTIAEQLVGILAAG